MKRMRVTHLEKKKKPKTRPKNIMNFFVVKMRRVIDGEFCDQRASIIETQNIPSYHKLKGIIKIKFLAFFLGEN
jgi:transcription antitermination factor NusG